MATEPDPEGIFLVLSNFFVVPSLFYALFLNQIPEAAILGIIGITSTFYHLCQTGFFCITKEDCSTNDNFSLMQFADEFFVFLAILWFIAYFFGTTAKYRSLECTISFVFIAQAIVFMPLVSKSGFLYYEIAIVVVSIFFFFFAAQKRTIIHWISFLIGILIIIAGAVLFIVGGDPGDRLYTWLHGVWHILLLVAVFFILDSRYGNLKRFFTGKKLKTRWRQNAHPTEFLEKELPLFVDERVSKSMAPKIVFVKKNPQ